MTVSENNGVNEWSSSVVSLLVFDNFERFWPGISLKTLKVWHASLCLNVYLNCKPEAAK